jgi:TatD DNase family protein
MLIDAHCHAHALDEEVLRRIEDKMIVIAVSEDLESSLKTLSLTEKFENIMPFIGVHPWSLEEITPQEIDEVATLIERREDVKGIGEVGLDGRRRNRERQIEVFRIFCRLSVEYALPMNIHARDAWREVLEVLRRMDVESALIHWFNGPLEILEEIRESGYMITINPAAKIQPRHREVIEEAPIDMILTESDGPYEYRGLSLRPDMVEDLVKLIAEVKGMRVEDVEEAIEFNFRRLFR